MLLLELCQNIGARELTADARLADLLDGLYTLDALGVARWRVGSSLGGAGLPVRQLCIGCLLAALLRAKFDQELLSHLRCL